MKEIRAINNDNERQMSKPPLPKRASKPPRAQVGKAGGKSGAKTSRKLVADPQDEVGDESDDSDKYQIIDKEKRKKGGGSSAYNRYYSLDNEREDDINGAGGGGGGMAIAARKPTNVQRTKGTSVRRLQEMQRRQYKADRQASN